MPRASYILVQSCNPSIPRTSPEPIMRQTLRRSCAACAKAKHSCDLCTPRCSRCAKRNIDCLYANEPWRPAPASTEGHNGKALRLGGGSGSSVSYRFGYLDPFDSYPPTRLPREHVQRLIYNCMSVVSQCRRHALMYTFSPPQNCIPVLSS